MSDSRAGWRRYLRFLRPDLKADVNDELGFHLEMRARDLERQGQAPGDAREAAERDFGDVAAIRDACLTIDERRFRRASRKERLMTLLHDVRLSVRSLLRSPGFTTISVLCLSLGIAATASIFTAVRGVLVRPLPYPDDDRLASIYVARPERQERGVNVSYHDYYAWRNNNRTFEDVALWTWSTITISSEDEAERVDGGLVTANLFKVLGVTPILGRNFLPDEEAPGTRVVMLGYNLWQRRFGGDRGIIGRTIRVNAVPHTVVGVMPASFAFPQVGQAWRPLPNDLQNDPGNRFYAASIGRLKPGIPLATASADLESVMRRQEERLPDAYKGWSADVVSLRDALVGDLRRPLLVFLGAVGMVLLIVCANVANLLLARGAARERELGVRAALGAGQGRIFTHVLLESSILAFAGGVLGVLLTPYGVRLFRLAFPNDVPFYISLAVDGWILALVAALVVTATILMGAIPSLRAASIDVGAALREGGRSGAAGARGSRTRNTLVVTELALSVVLLVGAVLLIRTYSALTNTNLGFDQEKLLAARVSLPPGEYRSREKRQAYWTAAYERLARIPGVEVVGSADGIPFSGWNVMASMSIQGRPPVRPGEDLDVHYQNLSPDYLKAIGTRIVAGRGLTAADRDTVNLVGVINETMAKTAFAGSDPVGQRMKWGAPDSEWPWITIVGVVSDFRHWTLPQPMKPAIYLSQLAFSSLSQTIVLRTSLAEPRSLEATVRSAMRELDRDAPAHNFQTFEQVVLSSLWRQRLQGRVLGLFATMALLLAAMGIYGVISHGVTQRTRELGVRMALGASRGKVAALILAQGSRLAVTGVAIGLAAAFLLRKAVAQLLYGVAPSDPVTFTVVPIVLVAVALGSSLIPALRATRVDPAVAMRAE
ncbi:MAG TPA: ABC transporter permease [Gemmatimonadaceae bacterium]|nr:ABC transporter permease [Gemmatimonadaceae bacterium]